MNEKKTILALDGLDVRSENVTDKVTVICIQHVPKELDDSIDGIIFHTPDLEDISPLIHKGIKRKIPLIFHGVRLSAVKDYIELGCDDYSLAYYSTNDLDLRNKIKQIFSE